MTARRKPSRGGAMSLDEFLDLHARLVAEEASALIDPPERRCAEGESPTGKERRNNIKNDQRPKTTSDAGVRWLMEHRRWEAARQAFIRQGKPIDAVLREWHGARGEFGRLNATLVARIVELTSESDCIVLLVNHLARLEKGEPDIRPSLDARMAAKFTIKRAGGLWRDALLVLDDAAWTGKAKRKRKRVALRGGRAA